MDNNTNTIQLMIAAQIDFCNPSCTNVEEKRIIVVTLRPQKPEESNSSY